MKHCLAVVAFKKLLFKLVMKMKSDIQISPCTSATIAAMQCYMLCFFGVSKLYKMDFKLRTKDTFAELTIETGNAKFIEDLASYKSDKGWFVDDNTIDQFITLANELSRFNHQSDVDFVKKIYDAFLSDSEKADFLEAVAQHSI